MEKDMANEDKLYAVIWVTLAAVMIVIVSSILAANLKTKGVMLQMVTEGADPIAAMCAMDAEIEGRRYICLQYIQAVLAND
jgi:hypothetical protein